jgi:hypothetical protein
MPAELVLYGLKFPRGPAEVATDDSWWRYERCPLGMWTVFLLVCRLPTTIMYSSQHMNLSCAYAGVAPLFIPAA